MNAPDPLNFAARRALPEAMLEALRQRFGDRCSTALAVREQHGRDESPIDMPPPDAVLFAESEDEVCFVLALASEHRVPVIPYGVGSSLEGHLLAVQGGLSLDVSRLNRILSINAEDLTVTVQPGVTRQQLNNEIRHQGLFFPIDPGADASLGGMAATRASGTNAVRYGTMRENVLGLAVVTACGERVRTGSRARKSSAGYDLTRLFVGSEGTLGVITELTLRLYPLPEAVSAAVCFFPSIDAAVQATIQIIQMGVPIARCELLDAHAIRAVNAHDKLGLREAPMLLMEFHGSPAGVAEQAQTVQEIARDCGGEDFDWATTPEARSRLWTARHHAYLSALQTRPGCRCVTTDTCVPISRLAQSINESVCEVEEAGIPYFIVGHVGDGNFHLGYLIDPLQPAERETAERLSAQMVARAIRLGGTCTGEHGIGLHKQAFLIEEAGEPAVAMMRSLKAALDPLNIMNPGKIFSGPR
ncbi:FAD-linked oxidase C-terminal domain-containing protein [Paucibacter sp. APW11]|uniref:D-lactate dehydrogenase (cytochrome) n=1 Tax=Roseateles aquae TaxID=3077235 RepID=A0ABU3PGC5_9BURK|nr:FAD-linked oxidase C-terminal domain-containing protein [Paucibacter sp. APW11]MDT9001599.1 FAD-linked oxidase C-terminal domain-containing protein [Paucibacter sp. APW11]